MLSNDAVKLLKWLEKHDQWMTPNEIEEDYKNFDARDLKSLKDQKMVDVRLNMDEGSWVRYRIADPGKAYLQNLRAQRGPETREWINTLLPLLTFLSGLLLSNPVKEFLRRLLELFS